MTRLGGLRRPLRLQCVGTISGSKTYGQRVAMQCLLSVLRLSSLLEVARLVTCGMELLFARSICPISTSR